MSIEKLKGKCRWCRYHLESREMYDKMCLLCKKMNAEYELKWELHPDIADAETTERERILCAAIWYKNLPREIDARGFQPVNIDKGIVVTGYRHGNCIATVKELSGLRSVKLAPDGVGELIQGFLTNKNRFVDRQEAMIIARKANQLINDDRTDTLFSEDLY